MQQYTLSQLYSLIHDYKRTNSYAKFCASGMLHDKIVVDCGAGSGIVTWLALQNGAKQVVSIDINSDVCAYLKRIFVNEPRVKVVQLDLTKDILPKGDIYIHELFGNALLGEGVSHIFKNFAEQNITSLYPHFAKVFTARIRKGHSIESTVRKKLLNPVAQEFLNFNIEYIPSTELLRDYPELHCELREEKHILDLRKPIPQNVKETVYNHSIVWEVGFDKDFINMFSNYNNENNNWRPDVDYRSFIKWCNLETN